MCEVLSTKAKFIDYRPLAHHKLHMHDFHFDSRFNAFLRCEAKVKAIYCQEIRNSHNISSVNTLFGSSSSPFTNLPAKTILSGLSEIDKQGMIEGLIDDLEANGSNTVLSSSCVEITCAHDILSEILVEFSSKVQALSMDKRRSSRPMDSLNPNLLLGGEHASTSSNCISTFKKLYDYYIGNVNTELASVVLLFRQTEALDADILGGFIDLIKSISASFNIRLLFVHSLSRPVRFHLSQSFQSSVSLNLHPIHSIGSGELYDITVGRVLTARDIPVTIPADVVGWIHEGFWRSDRCVSSAIDKILLCLAVHFEHRRSILCMFEDSKWLLDMGLVKSIKSSVHGDLLRNVYETIQYLTIDDLEGTGLLEAPTGSPRPPGSREYLHLLSTTVALGRLRSALFQIILLFRNQFIPHRCLEFSSDTIYAALLNHKGTKNHLLSDFCRIICDGIRYVSFGTISTVILNAIEILDVDIPREIMDHLPTEERKLVTTLSLNLYENSEMFTALVDELRSARLQGVSEDSDAESASVEAITLDWLLSEMKDDMLMKKSQNKSPCVNSHSNSQSHIDNPNNWSDSQSTILPSDSNSPTILYVGSPTSESLKPISQAIVQKPSLGVIASGVIEDVKTTLRSYVTEYSRLPTRDRVPGVLEVCSDTVKEAISLADTRIRYNWSKVFITESAHDESLSRWGSRDDLPVPTTSHSSEPSVVGHKSPVKKKGAKVTRPSAVNASKEAQMMQSSSSIPRKIALHDQYTLMQRARACLGVEHLYVWFDHFLNHAQPWTAANSNPSRKRKVINLDNDVDDDEDEGGADRGGIENSSSYYGEFSDNEMIQMRCRFHIGLNDLLRSGVIALKNNGTAVAKQYFSWMTE